MSWQTKRRSKERIGRAATSPQIKWCMSKAHYLIAESNGSGWSHIKIPWLSNLVLAKFLKESRHQGELSDVTLA